jgi:hypothetical protein
MTIAGCTIKKIKENIIISIGVVYVITELGFMHNFF